MKKINLIIFILSIFPVAADDLINENNIKKLHPSYQEDAYVVTFQGSPNSFNLKDIEIKKPKARTLKKL